MHLAEAHISPIVLLIVKDPDEAVAFPAEEPAVLDAVSMALAEVSAASSVLSVVASSLPLPLAAEPASIASSPLAIASPWA